MGHLPEKEEKDARLSFFVIYFIYLRDDRISGNSCRVKQNGGQIMILQIISCVLVDLISLFVK